MEPDMTGTNDVQALRRQLDAGTLTWRGPAVMLFARSAWAVVAQALVAAIFALRSSPTPWRDAEPWLPVYGTLIDAGCLALLWQLTRREGVRLLDIVGFDRTRLVPDVLLGFALIPVGLVFILGGVNATGWLLYGTLTPPYLFEPLPLAAAFYGVLVFPLVWGLTEQMTYNGYLVPRFQVLYGSTSRAVALVAFVWSFQHAVMPLTFDAKYMAFRLLSPVPFSFFQTLLYLRLRRLIPFAIAHAFLDGRRERADRRAYSTIEGVTPRPSEGVGVLRSLPSAPAYPLPNRRVREATLQAKNGHFDERSRRRDRVKAGDRAPGAKPDPLRHLRRFEHVVR
jgi:hypothetical protein